MKEKIKKYVEMWESRCYFDGIPDEAPRELETLNKVPSYRSICFAILKNDHSLKSLGLNTERSKWYGVFKKIEIEERKPYIQLYLVL